MANRNRSETRRKNKRKIMRSLTITELSGVDTPAQEGARALMLKRADAEPAKDPESFISMVKAGDFNGTHTTLTSDEGLRVISSCPVAKDYQVPVVSDCISMSDVVFAFSKSPEDEVMEKLVLLTTESDGHQHAVRMNRWELDEMGGSTSYQGGSVGEAHSHDYIINEDGSITIGDANGHSHEVEMSIMQRLQAVFTEKSIHGDSAKEDEDKKTRRSKARKGSSTSMEKSDMDEKEVQALIAKALEETNATHAAELAKAQAIGELTDVQKSYYNDLPEGEQAGFLALTSDARQAAVDSAIAKRDAADPVVYTAGDGTEFRKSDDPRMVKMAKERDEDRAELAKMREESETVSLTKRAQELSSLPGTVETKVQMLKAIDAISNAKEREDALTTLKAQNTEMARAFETHGVRPGDTPVVKSAEQELDGLVKKYASDNQVEEAIAYGKVLETPEGIRLYEQAVRN
jgi:hypothetical protein